LFSCCTLESTKSIFSLIFSTCIILIHFGICCYSSILEWLWKSNAGSSSSTIFGHWRCMDKTIFSGICSLLCFLAPCCQVLA
jgi:hypothetical protein